MIALLQRVSEASVSAGGAVTGTVGRGLLVLLCAVQGDTERELDLLVRKVAQLRIFEDAAGKMNRSVLDIGGGALVVPQFTLAASVRKGTRPSFDRAEAPERARRLCDDFVDRLRATGIRVATGRFGELMQVSLVNDGPVTIIIDTRDFGSA